MEYSSRDWLKTALLVIALGGLIGGLVLTFLSGRPDRRCGPLASCPCRLRFLSRSCAASCGEVGLDIAAALSMSTALVFGEPLAAAVVAVMYSGGAFLESFAEGRAPRNARPALAFMPVEGSLIQEAIDVAVILNVLRALRISPAGTGPAGVVLSDSRSTQLQGNQA